MKPKGTTKRKTKPKKVAKRKSANGSRKRPVIPLPAVWERQ
jgi:hypothetical protein